MHCGFSTECIANFIFIVSVLRSLSAAARSRQAFELERRAINLLLEEGNTAFWHSSFCQDFCFYHIQLLSDPLLAGKTSALGEITV